jgi:hypothetical protein
MYPKEFINYQDKLYWVYNKVKETNIKQEYVQEIKSYWNCDIILKNNHSDDIYYYFLREIPDLEIISD